MGSQLFLVWEVALSKILSYPTPRRIAGLPCLSGHKYGDIILQDGDG